MSHDLESYFAAKMQDARFKDRYDDAAAIDELIDALVACRKELHLTQTDVAAQMGVKQPTVSGFESQDSDPRVSTLQRYARAIGARISFDLEARDTQGEWTGSLRRGTWSTTRPSTSGGAATLKPGEWISITGRFDSNKYLDPHSSREAFSKAA